MGTVFPFLKGSTYGDIMGPIFAFEITVVQDSPTVRDLLPPEVAVQLPRSVQLQRNFQAMQANGLRSLPFA